jgi:serine protease AprX
MREKNARRKKAGAELAPGSQKHAPAPDPDSNDSKLARENIERTLVKTVIALPLLDKINEAYAELYDIIIDLHQAYPTGRDEARKWIEETIGDLLQKSDLKEQQIYKKKSDYTQQYLFARLSGTVIRQLVIRDAALKTGLVTRDAVPKTGILLDKPGTSGPPAIYQIWEDFKINPLISSSISTIKCDAARKTFGAEGDDIVWAVIDSGVDANHIHFQLHCNLKGQVMEWHRDFTGEETPLNDGFGHGTHVAGIIAGEIPAGAEDKKPNIVAYARELKADNDATGREIVPVRKPIRTICGMAPKTKIVSLKVIDSKEQGSVSSIIAALAHVEKINSYGRYLHIHGINLSVGYTFDPEWFACGQSQLCVEVNRLVRSGVMVVVAAGNTGYGTVATEYRGGRKSGLALSINDPGNAEYAITVGSTHRDKPHVYGVSYFSSKGPTDDGRLKPDLVAPGEKIVSCATGKLRDKIAEKLDPGMEKPTYVESSGTSMAAPHVSGAIAALLSVKREFIGQPDRVKDILMSTAIDLRRDRQFQGAGLVDLMRAIQSI